MAEKQNTCCLVLGGGRGGRGTYEIGVSRAMRELGIGFHTVAGTSDEDLIIPHERAY